MTLRMHWSPFLLSLLLARGEDLTLYPATLEEKPDLPSPYLADGGLEIVTARTRGGRYALIPVGLAPGAAVRPWNRPFEVDREDFPTLARTGLHSEIELDLTRTITGRSIAEITELGRPGALSSAGFLARDEDIISVLKGDNRLVKKLGLTHAQLARPLIHVCNMIRTDLELDNITWRRHRWENLDHFVYNGKKVFSTALLTKGGQESIFDDGIGGAWSIEIRRDLDEGESRLLDTKYAHLDEKDRQALRTKLSRIHAGEMQPFYILRYGFYEGHTDWRTDPIAIAFVFGLKTIDEIDRALPGQLDKVLLRSFAKEN